MMHKAEPTRARYSNPWRPAIIGGGVVAGFLILLGTWGVAAPLSSAVVAQGSLQVEGRRQHVQHPYGGVVRKINVREASRVKAGDVLISLSNTEARARLNVLRQNQVVLLAEKTRLIAERDGVVDLDISTVMPADADPAAVKEAAANEAAVLGARNNQYTTRLDVIRQQIVQLKQESEGVASQMTGLEQQAALLDQEMVGLRRLAASQAASRNQVMALEARQSEARANISSRRAQMASLQSQIGEAQLRSTELQRERIAEVTSALQQTDAKLAELGPQLETAEDTLARSEIRAPATGQVVGLKVHTEGGVIDAGESLMEIVPSDSSLFVDARIRLSDISDVKTGQTADIRLNGIPREIRPEVTGTVRSVSADSLVEQSTGAGYYALQIELDAEDIGARQVALQPGMPVQAIIETRPRTLAEYLAGPLLDEITGSFRER